MNKNLKDKAIEIKGKSYVQVTDRVIYFNETYKNGSIKTEIINQEESTITIKATITPDIDKPERIFTGLAQEWKDDPRSMVNKTSFVENCETSAVGRALAMLGIGVIDSIASVDEISIAKNKEACYSSNKDLPWLNVTDYNTDVINDTGRKIKEELVSGKSAKEVIELAEKKYKLSKKVKETIEKWETETKEEEPFEGDEFNELTKDIK